MLPTGITKIGYASFAATDLGNVEIPNTVQTISEMAFIQSWMKALTFENNSTIKEIGPSAFEGCNYLTTVKLPKSLSSLHGGAFSQCSGLQNITFEGTMSQWETITSGFWSSSMPATQITCSDGVIPIN